MNQPQLTDRERDLIIRVANGQTYTAIGRAYYVGERAARRHVDKLRDRLGARDRAHLVGLAVRARLVTAEDLEQPTAAAV